MARMVALAGSVAAAEALIGAIAASPAAAADRSGGRHAADDANAGSGRRVQGLCRRAAHPLAEGDGARHSREPRASTTTSAMSRDVLASPDFRAVAPDFLSPSGGTPANEDAAREAIGKLDLGKSVSDAVAMLDELAKSQPRRQGRRGRLLLGRRLREPARRRRRRQARRRRSLLRPGARSVRGRQGPGALADPRRRAGRPRQPDLFPLGQGAAGGRQAGEVLPL